MRRNKKKQIEKALLELFLSHPDAEYQLPDLIEYLEDKGFRIRNEEELEEILHTLWLMNIIEEIGKPTWRLCKDNPLVQTIMKYDIEIGKAIADAEKKKFLKRFDY